MHVITVSIYTRSSIGHSTSVISINLLLHPRVATDSVRHSRHIGRSTTTIVRTWPVEIIRHTVVARCVLLFGGILSLVVMVLGSGSGRGCRVRSLVASGRRRVCLVVHQQVTNILQRCGRWSM